MPEMYHIVPPPSSPDTLERECVAEEAALRDATARDRDRHAEICRKVDATVDSVSTVQKEVEELTLDTNGERQRRKREEPVAAQARRKVEKAVVSK